MNTRLFFKSLYFIGTGMAFLGIFFDFYYYKSYIFYDILISDYSYNLFEGLNMNFSFEEFLFASLDPILFIIIGWLLLKYPSALSINPLFHILFLGIIIASTFFLLFKRLEDSKNLSDLSFYAFLHVFLLLLVGFYTVVFPMFYLTPNKLYFPLITIKEPFFGIIYHYSLGIGYFLEFIAFILLFPYAIFYLQTVRNYEISDKSTQIIENLIKQSNINIDFDKLIAEEEFEVNFKNHTGGGCK